MVEKKKNTRGRIPRNIEKTTGVVGEKIVPKGPGGRPTKLTPEFQIKAREVVTEIMSNGGSIVEVAHALNIRRCTLYDWLKKNEEFSDTITKGLQLREIWFEKTTRKNLENPKFNTQLFSFYAMNSVGWSKRDKSSQEITVKTTDIVKEAAQKRINQLEE